MCTFDKLCLYQLSNNVKLGQYTAQLMSRTSVSNLSEDSNPMQCQCLFKCSKCMFYEYNLLGIRCGAWYLFVV